MLTPGYIVWKPSEQPNTFCLFAYRACPVLNTSLASQCQTLRKLARDIAQPINKWFCLAHVYGYNAYRPAFLVRRGFALLFYSEIPLPGQDDSLLACTSQCFPLARCCPVGPASPLLARVILYKMFTCASAKNCVWLTGPPRISSSSLV